MLPPANPSKRKLKGLVAYAAGTAELETITALDLSHAAIQAEWPAPFAKVPDLSFLPRLESLNLSGHQITAGIPSTMALEELTHLKELDISFNLLDGSAGVLVPIGIQQLNLSRNPLIWNGVPPRLLICAHKLQALNLKEAGSGSLYGLWGLLPLQELNLENLELTEPVRFRKEDILPEKLNINGISAKNFLAKQTESWKAVEWLWVNDLQILEGITILPKLKRLFISKGSRLQIPQLPKLPALEILSIENWGQIGGLERLLTLNNNLILYLKYNNLKEQDILPLVNKFHLIDLRGNPLQRKKLPKLLRRSTHILLDEDTRK